METLSQLHFLARFYHAFSNPLATLQRHARPTTSRKKKCPPSAGPPLSLLPLALSKSLTRSLINVLVELCVFKRAALLRAWARFQNLPRQSNIRARETEGDNTKKN